MYFIDRYDAAMQLVDKLKKYRRENAIVLAVPRGGVPIGYFLARHLDFDLDLLMTKKIGHPLHEEYAIGAVGLEDIVIDERDDIPPEYLKEQTDLIRLQLKQQYKKFMGREAPADISGRTVIVVDDGVATGRTILVALKMLRQEQAAKLVVAVPVAAEEAAALLKQEVDDFICLYTPSPFYAVGKFYQNFNQVNDEEVMVLLQELNKRNTRRE
ncbi:phosphoribosyltransferase [Chitinophaga varians]|uniref:phosphoribosyltransferase n=1 Tax=Chitinophaga varians TaxID=2202339 RepID=UPI00165F3C89|nr:phosphoribosyltransferase family protein [Chitinophaga varians]MBC9912562.1 phosphoribosyltransferase [Chitinophaga varians]